MGSGSGAGSSGGWEEEAACRDAPLELFFPEGGEGTAEGLAETVEGLAICRVCGVREQCLDDAEHADGGAPYGTRGGLTENERRRLRARVRSLGVQ